MSYPIFDTFPDIRFKYRSFDLRSLKDLGGLRYDDYHTVPSYGPGRLEKIMFFNSRYVKNIKVCFEI